ncbi:MAG: hypothetical protein JKY68_02985 [Rhodospirillales bacterium]|nr:hypothetical protein [Rhodospirillales bacterium]
MAHIRSVAGMIVIAGALIAGPALAAKKYKGGPVENGGAIRGSVVFEGPVPMLKVVIPAKDRAACGNDREGPALVVGPEKGVRDVFAYIKKVKKGKPWAKPARAAVLRNVKCRFDPHVQVIRKGKLMVINDDPVLHNTHGFYGRRTAFNMALPKQGEKIKASLRRTGFVRMECDVHAWMRAYIYVAKNPYWAITDDGGAFSLTDVPPGKYTLVVAQGHLKTVGMPVTVKPDGDLTLTIKLKE